MARVFTAASARSVLDYALDAQARLEAAVKKEVARRQNDTAI